VSQSIVIKLGFNVLADQELDGGDKVAHLSINTHNM